MRNFKAKKMCEGLDWESIKDRYETIRETFVSILPKQAGSEECAHSTDFFTKERIVSKIKQIRAKLLISLLLLLLKKTCHLHLHLSNHLLNSNKMSRG